MRHQADEDRRAAGKNANPFGRDHAQAARYAELLRDHAEAQRQWNIVFNGEFPR